MGELMVRAKMQLESPGLWASFMSVWFSWSSWRLSGLLRRSIIVLSLTAQFGRWESVKMTTKAKATATACCLFEFLLSGLAHGHCFVIVFVMDGPAGGSAAFNTHSLSPVLFSRIVHDSQMKKPKPPLPLPPLYCLLCVLVWGEPDWTKNLMRLRVFWLCHSSLAASSRSSPCNVVIMSPRKHWWQFRAKPTRPRSPRLACPGRGGCDAFLSPIPHIDWFQLLFGRASVSFHFI